MGSVTKYSGSTVQHLIENFFELVENGDAEGPESWQSIKYGDNLPCEVPGLGTLNHVQDYGGEGKGDEYWVVFSVMNSDGIRHFRMDGGYSSYSGAEFDGNLREVVPEEKVITVWR